MNAAKRRKNVLSFTLILGGQSGLTEELEAALYEAGCDDALLGSRDGALFLDFDREAAVLTDAILSAIADVRDADAGVWVARVEPDDLVTASEIARRTGRSRESIRLLAQGERGPGTFPAPVANLSRKSPIWRWTEVCDWFLANFEEGEPQTIDDARAIAAINAALELSRHAPSPNLINKLWTVAERSPKLRITRRKR